MFFEDEKDFIGDPADIRIDEDGTVSWESVLSDTDDEDLGLNSVVDGEMLKVVIRRVINSMWMSWNRKKVEESDDHNLFEKQ